MLHLNQLKKSHKYSRFIQILVAIGLIIGLQQLWHTSWQAGLVLLQSQTQQMVQLLIKQTSNGAVPALELNDDKHLDWLANTLIQDAKILAISIYDVKGNRRAFAQSISNKQLAPTSSILMEKLHSYPTYIEPVFQDELNLGYIEISINSALFFEEIKNAHHQNMMQHQIMLIVAGIIGFLLAQSLSFKRIYYDIRKARSTKLKKTKRVKE